MRDRAWSASSWLVLSFWLATLAAAAAAPVTGSPSRTTVPPAGIDQATTDDAIAIRSIGQIGGEIRGVDGEGRYAYAGIGPRLGVFDVINPRRPTLIATSAPLEDLIEDVLYRDGRVYVAAGTEGLVIFDVAGAPSPAPIGRLSTAPNPSLGLDLSASGERLLLADGDLALIDVSDPREPRLQRRFFTPGPATDALLDGETAFVSGGRLGTPTAGHLLILDLRTARAVADLAFPGSAVQDVLLDQTNLVVGLSGLVLVFDISNPSEPRQISRVNALVNAFQLKSSRLIVAARNGFDIFHLDPAGVLNPLASGLSESAGALWLVGDHAVAAAGASGLVVVELGPPSLSRVRRAGVYRTISVPQSVLRVGQSAYVSTFFDGLHVLDISQPDDPQRIGHLEIPAIGPALAASGGRLFATGEVSSPDGIRSHAILSLDIADPERIMRLGQVPMSPNTLIRTFHLSGDRLYALGERELIAFDIRDLDSPSEIDRLTLPRGFHSLALRHGIGYVVSTPFGSGIPGPQLRVIDLAHPLSAGPAQVQDLPLDAAYALATTARELVVFGSSGPYVTTLLDSPADDLKPGDIGALHSVIVQAAQMGGPYWLTSGLDASGSPALMAFDLRQPLAARAAGKSRDLNSFQLASLRFDLGPGFALVPDAYYGLRVFELKGPDLVWRHENRSYLPLLESRGATAR